MTVGRSSRLAPAVPIEEMDRLLLLVVAAIVGLGLLMVVSASITAADRELGQPFFYLTRQIIYLGIGIGVALGCLLVPMDVWERSSPIMLIVAYLLLAAVLIPGVGREVNGSLRHQEEDDGGAEQAAHPAVEVTEAASGDQGPGAAAASAKVD